ncbi:hypothetical protein VTL71DRAFT_16320 [Oculimacula yallundae]|uniref:Uncharacterized protein n=1 Tax=Oculimacula yallundae TaxID=86028 RepID=A0ABR4CFC4_9HELO
MSRYMSLIVWRGVDVVVYLPANSLKWMSGLVGVGWPMDFRNLTASGLRSSDLGGSLMTGTVPYCDFRLQFQFVQPLKRGMYVPPFEVMMVGFLVIASHVQNRVAVNWML